MLYAGRYKCFKYTNDELRLLDVLISIAITTIFYDDSGKIKAMDSIKRMPVFDDYLINFRMQRVSFLVVRKGCICRNTELQLKK